MLRIHGERLADIALTAPEEREPDLATSSGAPAAVEVRNLRFRYSEQDPWVLDGVDLRIEPGESVAIVGGSGCGKTTLLKMLASLLQPSEGEVRIDGRRIDQVGLGAYREMLGVVMQDDQLFAGSIAENIAFFSDRIDHERVCECARKAAVHDAIVAMPMGYATLIGDMGAALSGGQKQRILIARALYKNPSVLLLDEATSHLDVIRERAVNEAISKSRLTRIIVAHRPETILSADRVIVLADGKIVGEKRRGEVQLSTLLEQGHVELEDGTAPAPTSTTPVEELLAQWRARADRPRLAYIAEKKPIDEPTGILAAATRRVKAFVMPEEAVDCGKRKRRVPPKKSPPPPKRTSKAAAAPRSCPLTRKRGAYARVRLDE